MITLSSCPVEGDSISKVELYFGLDILGGGSVKPLGWRKFLNDVITPRFPDGLTIDKISGQWQDAKTDETISSEAEQAIEDIRANYKSQFSARFSHASY